MGCKRRDGTDASPGPSPYDLEEAIPTDRLEPAHQVPAFGGGARPPDDQGLALDEVVLDRAPDTRVRRIVAVVTHDKDVARRHDGAAEVMAASRFLEGGVAL